MIVIIADSLRVDFAKKFLTGIFPQETWHEFDAIETHTAPVLATIITGKTPEELGISRGGEAFYKPIPADNIDDILFDYFDSYITISRLIGNRPNKLAPIRKQELKFLHPIPWNAVSNHDDDVLEFVGRKWSMVTNDWWDLIFYHSWLTHGPWGIDDYWEIDIPTLQNSTRWMEKKAKEGDINAIHKWYELGVKDLRSRLVAFKNISNNLETIILTADHGEALGERGRVSHFPYGYDIPELRRVPLLINRDVDIPQDLDHKTLKNWIVEVYKEFELENEAYQRYRERKRSRH